MEHAIELQLLGDPRGVFWVAYYMEKAGVAMHIVVNMYKSVSHLVVAAGYKYAKLGLAKTDPFRYQLLGCASNYSDAYRQTFIDEVDKFYQNADPNVKYQMGKAIVKYNIQFGRNDATISYFEYITSAKKAVNVWLLYARYRLYIIKDVRIMIGKIIWKTRSDWSKEE